jgi:hypothetical protein
MMNTHSLPLSRLVRVGSWSAVALAIAVTAGCSQSGNSFTVDRSTVNGLPKVVATEKAWATAKVEAIDYANRSIALTGPDGTTHIFKVSSAVANFDQVKQGDTVNMEVLDRVTVNVRDAYSPPVIEESVGVELAELGSLPGIVATRSVEVNATVAAIDYQARTISLTRTGEALLVITVSPKMKNFNNISVGNQVIFTYTEAISITVKS